MGIAVLRPVRPVLAGSCPSNCVQGMAFVRFAGVPRPSENSIDDDVGFSGMAIRTTIAATETRSDGRS